MKLNYPNLTHKLEVIMKKYYPIAFDEENEFINEELKILLFDVDDFNVDDIDEIESKILSDLIIIHRQYRTEILRNEYLKKHQL